MDMYQKRKMRKEKREQNEGQNQNGTRTCISWYPGHMAKTKRLIKENYKLIDIVFELVDSRVPYSSKIKDFDSVISNKPRILIMTKKDLCDVEITKKWIEYYEKQNITVLLVDLNNNQDYKKIINTTHELTKTIQEDRLNKGLKEKEIRALVVGIPNVGKSTLINRLAGRKVANVGNTPGVTKNLTWLKTKENILLLDTPGILWPKFDNQNIALNLAATTAIKTEVLDNDEVAVHILKLLNNYYPKVLKERYKINNFDEEYILECYEEIGRHLGALSKGGEVNFEKVSLKIVNDIKQEGIKGITFDNGDING